MALVFYDVETTGLHPSFDQILQFAAIRTDTELNETERFEIRSQLQAHIIPAPAAVRINGLSVGQLLDPTLPSHYEMVCQIREKLLAWSPALFMGFNSLRFDERFLQQALYQTLHLPYLSSTNGNCRSDVLPLLQATAIFAPDTIVVPVDDDGKSVFRLELIAPANGVAYGLAHDALADARAALHIARLISERAPEVWSSFMRFSQKPAVASYVADEPMFCVSEFHWGQPYSWLVTAIGRNEKNNAERYLFNLSVEPESLMALTDEDLADRLKVSPKPVRRLRCNAAPILVAADEAPDFAAGKELPYTELSRRVEFLRSEADIIERLIAAYEAGWPERPVSEHVELQIYDTFIPKSDEKLLDQFHTEPWEKRSALLAQLSDLRLKKLGRRLIYAERPDLIRSELRQEIEKAQARRVLGKPEGLLPWRTVPQALSELEEALVNASDEEAQFLKEHRTFLLNRQAAANLLLGSENPA